MHTNIRLPALMLSVAALALVATACGNTTRPSCNPRENANLRIEASDRLNPNEEGRPLPTILRIYQLSRIGAAETASFDDLWNNDAETLGDAMLGKDELVVYPDSRFGRQFERNPEANYIVGMGVFRRPAGVSWRTILELPPPAAEAQCQALQEDPDAPPAAQPNVFLTFELDDFQIEGTVRLEYPPPPCADDDLMCQAEREAAEAAEGAAPEAPEGPEAPEAPQANMPSTQTPSAPTP